MRLARPGANSATADSRARSPRVARTRTIYLLLALLAAAGVILSLGWGAVSIRPDQIAGILLDKAGVASGIDFTPQQSIVLWNIRLPRVLMAAAVGAALALAGAALQVTFGNQLADPTLLGVSGAATLGVVMAYLFGAVGLGRWVLPLAACLAATVSVVWLIGFARRHGRSDRLTLVLSGVALQLFLAGVVTLLVSAVRDGMPDASFLTLGGLTGIFWRDVAVAAPVVIVVAALLLRRAPELNILLLGDDAARSLGVNVGRTRLMTGALAAVATGTVVAYSGSIAFVGLVVPFLLRRLLGDDHRVLLPATLLGGVSLLTFGDAAARNLVSPMELPLGVLMTVIGGPLFFWLIGRGRGVGSW
ncbi:MAG: iron ABC transporter permease [Trueperaceae bacterium]|nr:iron ABC transporter permease [Truepera sp.]HRN18905.1 iron ABC transporter permease [Trueperaceae bacterium]HRQ09707.1 iron ABC transporter permease [Trueperaceae bacterium]